jgi:hypothetical protein
MSATRGIGGIIPGTSVTVAVVIWVSQMAAVRRVF